jgi:hypothetical protein
VHTIYNMETTFAKILVNRSKTSLIVIFNDMSSVGTSTTFEYYKTFVDNFIDYDVLFVKDISYGTWYIAIMNELAKYIEKVCARYEYVYAFGSSSGSIPLLNIMPNIPNFIAGTILNGQASLEKGIQRCVTQFNDCATFDSSILGNIRFDNRYLSPLTRISQCTYTIHFFYNLTGADKVYCDYVRRTKDEMNLRNVIVHTENLNLSHRSYIVQFMSSTVGLDIIKNIFIPTKNRSNSN